MSKHKDATMTTATETRTAEAELVEKVFGAITTDGLPAALGAALVNLAALAVEMRPDDVSLTLDLPAGVLTFRCYRRAGDRA